MARKVAAYFVIAIHLSGCTTLAPVDIARVRSGSAVVTGDDVTVTTRAGQTRQLTVTSVTTEAICGSAQCVPTADILRLERQEIDGWRTAGMVLLVLLAAGLAAAATSLGAVYPAGL